MQGSGRGESSFFMGRRLWHESISSQWDSSEGDKSKLLQNCIDRGNEPTHEPHVCKPNHSVTHSL